MDRSARLFLCARCRDQVLLCSHCDRGQQYCSRACASVSRRERRRETAERYQRSRGGQLKHAARSAKWRQRRRSLRQARAGMDIDKVTHQGCPNVRADASLQACHTLSADEDPSHNDSATTDSHTPANDTAMSAGPVESPRVCRRCGHPLRLHVRQGYRHTNISLPARRGYDHRPGAGRPH
jgi:hypothetical protein